MDAENRIKAKNRLLRRQKETGWAGEAVLYYWIEILDGMKGLTVSIRDPLRGPWALLALKSMDGH